MGRPNAGKSSIVNAFIGEDRNIVTEIAGTTRDSIYTRYNKFGFDFYLVDTAGIRKKNKVNEDLEYYSVIRSIRSIENADVCILMVDATRGIESQDLKYLLFDSEECQGASGCGKQVGLGAGQDCEGDEDFRRCYPQPFRSVCGFPYHLCFGTDQTAYSEGIGGGA